MRTFSSLLLLTGLAVSAFAQAPPPPDSDGPPDEPGRQVARLSILNGDAQIKRADTGEWVAAAVNTPLMMGDSLAVGNNGRAEIQFDSAHFARIAADSEIRLWNLEDNRVQVQVAHGLITWRVLRQGGMPAEISTPVAAIRPVGLPSIRVEVAPDGATRVTPRNGEADVFISRGNERVREGNVLVLQGQADNPEFHTLAAPGRDGWDQFNEQRDTFLSGAQSPRYVPAEVYGSEDLDPYGRWVDDPAYGSVWSPNVPASWAPYRYGRWVWQDYYGWTWVDDASWGWAPFHYGSWYYRVGYGWCWFPGARGARHFYRPAMVSFFGAGGYSVGVGFGHVGWVPLAPFEAYRPWYGRGGRNVTNITVINNTNIYNTYRNSRSYNGVTAVAAGDFQRGNYRHPVTLNQGQLENASLVRGGGPIAPTENNLHYSDRGYAGRPRGADTQNRGFYSRMGAPQNEASRPTFADQQSAVRSGLDARGGSGSPGFRNAPPAQNQNQPQQQNDRPAWQRFGRPDQTDAGQNNRIDRQRPEPPQAGFGRQRNGNGSSDPRPLDVAPPVVRQRDSDPGINNRRGSGFGAPMPEQRQDRPTFQPRPAPQERPAPQMRSTPQDRPAPQARPSGGDSGRQARPSGGGERAPRSDGGNRGRSQF